MFSLLENPILHRFTVPPNKRIQMYDSIFFAFYMCNYCYFGNDALENHFAHISVDPGAIQGAFEGYTFLRVAMCKYQSKLAQGIDNRKRTEKPPKLHHVLR